MDLDFSVRTTAVPCLGGRDAAARRRQRQPPVVAAQADARPEHAQQLRAHDHAVQREGRACIGQAGTVFSM